MGLRGDKGFKDSGIRRNIIAEKEQFFSKGSKLVALFFSFLLYQTLNPHIPSKSNKMTR